jgi:hypothetical protein
MVLWALLVGPARPARGDAAWDEARKQALAEEEKAQKAAAEPAPAAR